MPDSVPTDRGRKVIFLHPHSVVSDPLVQAVAQQEYEVYLVKDHIGLKRVLGLPEFHNALLFTNIDEELSESEWKDYVRDLRKSPATSHVHIGVLSYNEDAALAATYLMDIGVQGGFIKLKLGIAESTRIIFSTLEATEARGQRRNVRVSCADILGVFFSVKVRGTLHRGRLLDASSAGIACVFDTDPRLEQGTSLPDIQLKLKASVVMVAGTVAGTREANAGRVYVILFAQPLREQVKERIFRFIHECLQARMKRLLDTGLA
jgi:hypothetical protein